MGLIKRLKRITSARVDAFLESAENPAAVLSQLIKELREQVQVAGEAESKALLALKAAQRRLDEAEGRAARLSRGAELALSQGDEATAREALAVQIKAEQEAKTHRDALERATHALEDARTARIMVNEQLRELEDRGRSLMARSTAASAALNRSGKPESAVARGQSLLDDVLRLETALDKDEAELQARRDMREAGSLSLEERLKALERDAEVSRRLEEVRKTGGK